MLSCLLVVIGMGLDESAVGKIDYGRVALDHAGRIKALETDMENQKDRIDGLEQKFDRIMTLGWRMLFGLGIAAAAPFLAMIFQHVKW